MLSGMTDERRTALWGLAAGSAGIGLQWIMNNWHPSSALLGLLFTMLYIFLLYIWAPFVFAALCFGIIEYAVGVKSAVNRFSLFNTALLAAALALAAHLIFYYQQGAVLIITAVFFVLRLVWRYIT